MAPKKARIERGEGSSQSGGFDARIFVSAAAQARYQQLREKIVIGDRALECKNEPYRHGPEYDEVRRQIITRNGSHLWMPRGNQMFLCPCNSLQTGRKD